MSEFRAQIGIVQYAGGTWGVLLRSPGKPDLYSQQEWDTEEEAKTAMRAWSAENADTVDPVQ